MKVSVTAIAIALGAFVLYAPLGVSAADLSKDKSDQLSKEKTDKSTTEKTTTEKSSTDIGKSTTDKDGMMSESTDAKSEQIPPPPPCDEVKKAKHAKSHKKVVKHTHDHDTDEHDAH